MPYYQFACLDCEASFEVKRPFARASDPATCPTCDSAHTQKQLSAVAFQTSGSSIPVPMHKQGGGCGCGGGCACQH